MKKVIIISTIILLMTGCSSMKIENGKITCSQKDILLEDEKTILVDVRTKEEYDEGHLDDAINAPYDVIVSELKDLGKDTPIIVYCKSGVRSAKAIENLKNAGYTNLYDLGSISNC